MILSRIENLNVKDNISIRAKVSNFLCKWKIQIVVMTCTRSLSSPFEVVLNISSKVPKIIEPPTTIWFFAAYVILTLAGLVIVTKSLYDIEKRVRNRYPRKVRHFDINGTITIVDRTDDAEGVDVSEANKRRVNEVLARNTRGLVDMENDWGMADGVFGWEGSKTQCTYYDYLKSTGDKNYKQLAATFTNHVGSGVAHLVPLLLKSIEGFFFESFIRYVARSLDEDPDVLFVFRTFGVDREETMAKLQEIFPGEFDCYYFGKFVYHEGDIVEVHFDNGTILEGWNEINDFFATSDYHVVLQESYKWWNDHGKEVHYGKGMISDERLDQSFRDDNECVYSLNYHGTGGFVINRTFYRVNTVEAALDPNYFFKQEDWNARLCV